MKKNRLISVLTFTLLFILPLITPLSSQGQSLRTAVTSLKITEARWGQEGGVGIYFDYTVINPYLRGTHFDRWGKLLNNPIKEQNPDKKASIEYRPDNRYSMWIEVPKEMIKENALLEYEISCYNNEYYSLGYNDPRFPPDKKDPSIPPTIKATCLARVIKKDGYFQIQGVTNHLRENLKDDYVEKLSEDAIATDVNKVTGKPWEYIVSDGVSALKITLNIPKSKSVSYKVSDGDGFISTNYIPGSNRSPDGNISLKEGKAVVYYHPPELIPESKNFSTKMIDNSRSLKFFPAKIVFTAKMSDGTEEYGEVIINYCRTPVIMVHGFTGDKSTWELLDRMLSQKGFMSNREDYYLVNRETGTMDIQSQAEMLSSIITLEKVLFTRSNVMINRFDIVSHSMGGLIARYYSTLSAAKGTGVRKIIMVGTPNHGIFNTSDLITGELASYFSDTHKGMAQNVNHASPQMQSLNRGESGGNHLNKLIEYGNIYVDGTDGVVESRSARLNGVSEVILTKMKHSPSIPDFLQYGTRSITTDFMVFGKIIGWLINPIPKGSLDMNKWDIAEIVTPEANVDLTGKGHILKLTSGQVTLKRALNNIEADRSAKGEIRSPDGSVILIKPTTKLGYNDDMTELLLFNGQTVINLKRVNNTFIVNTPEMRVGVRGTSFEVGVDEAGKSSLFVYDGKVEVSNNSGTKTMAAGDAVTYGNGATLSQSKFNTDNRFVQQWQGDFPDVLSLGAFIGAKNPLFSKVKSGGDKTCSSLSVQFTTPIRGAPSNAQQQMQMKQISDQNELELFWFKKAENEFKQGKLPGELSGTYRPGAPDKPGTGKYYSETITLFKPMTIKSVTGNARGFRLIHGNSKKEQYFSGISTAQGVELVCGSYKIYVDYNDAIEKTWVTLTLTE